MTPIRFIGDVHGKTDAYLRLIADVPYSLQVGDMAFDYGFMENVNPLSHVFIGGNHDNYDKLGDCPNSLNECGIWRGVFYVRGAWSIDQKYRVFKLNWWPNEELGRQERDDALEFYKLSKPSVVVSHECPWRIVKYVTNPMVAHEFGFETGEIRTKTNMLLDAMTEFHKPEIHIFGHYHTSLDKTIDGTRYVCLPELGTLDLDV